MARLTQLLRPREREFFDLFDEAGRNIERAGRLIDEIFSAWPDQRELMQELVACEHEGDRITHEIHRRLNRTFVTPIDREDIYALASSLDDIVDYIEEAADFLGLYRIEAPMIQAQQMAGILAAACAAIAQALPGLRTFADVHTLTIEVNRLENEGDRLVREALASLFVTGIDPMLVIRWKDVFERLEAAIDSTERTANIIEGVLIKHS